jgi:hypothetical protein
VDGRIVSSDVVRGDLRSPRLQAPDLGSTVGGLLFCFLVPFTELFRHTTYN